MTVVLPLLATGCEILVSSSLKWGDITKFFYFGALGGRRNELVGKKIFGKLY